MTDTTLGAGGSSYTVVGSDATCRRVGVALSGSFVVSGQIADLVYSQNVPNKEMPVSSGSYAISGQSISFGRGYTFQADAVSYTITDESPSIVDRISLNPECLP